MAEAPKQRRLPTKTRSGIIALRPVQSADVVSECTQLGDLCEPLQPTTLTCLSLHDSSHSDSCQHSGQPQLLQTVSAGPLGHRPNGTEAGCLALHAEQCANGPCCMSGVQCQQGVDDPGISSSQGEPRAEVTMASQAVPSESRSPRAPAGSKRASVSFADDGGGSSAPSRPSGTQATKSGLPKSMKFVTGPLNASTAPTVVSLPVKRRGSYQSLKRVSGASASDPALRRKSTHWEKFGTILVLYCAASKHAEQDGGVLQMMMAEVRVWGHPIDPSRSAPQRSNSLASTVGSQLCGSYGNSAQLRHSERTVGAQGVRRIF